MTRIRRILAALALLGAAGSAAAHPGHGIATLVEGLAHPFGADHLLAMVAVGLWSAAAFQGARRALAPAVFLAAMAGGAAAGLAGLTLPFTESALALSVSAFGALLLARGSLPVPVGLAVVAAAASLHGLAHGTEMSAGSSVAAYAAGFLGTTALLHLAGLGLGRWLLGLSARVWLAAGSLLGVAGLALLARI